MKLQSLFFIFLMAMAACAPKKTDKSKETPNENNMIDVLVGVYTDQESDGIYSLSFNTETGELTNKNLMVTTTNPSYLTISKDRKFVYCVSETDSGKIASFSWDHAANKLNLIGEQSTVGSSPCYVDLNNDESLVAVANYSSGNLVTYPINKDGIIQSLATNYQHKGSGANAQRQKGPHAHCSLFNPSGSALYCVDLGIDQIVKYDVINNQVKEGSAAFMLDGGDGPRHLVFHPNKKIAFVVNELSNSVVALKVDEATGNFTMINRAGTLPEGYSETSYCADIHTSDDGKYLYVSNRGHNSIAIFSIAEDGAIALLTTEPSGGEWPRNFALSPDGNFLVVANQNTHNIVSFKVDKATGLLSKTGFEANVSKPVCLKF